MHWLFLIDRKWLFLFGSTWLIQPDANSNKSKKLPPSFESDLIIRPMDDTFCHSHKKRAPVCTRIQKGSFNASTNVVMYFYFPFLRYSPFSGTGCFSFRLIHGNRDRRSFPHPDSMYISYDTLYKPSILVLSS